MTCWSVDFRTMRVLIAVFAAALLLLAVDGSEGSDAPLVSLESSLKLSESVEQVGSACTFDRADFAWHLKVEPAEGQSLGALLQVRSDGSVWRRFGDASSAARDSTRLVSTRHSTRSLLHFVLLCITLDGSSSLPTIPTSK